MWNGTPGTEAEERVRGVGSYLDVLGRLQQELKPRNYLEIGVRHGRSLSLAHGPATGVDPAPEIQIALPHSTRIVAKTSDEFFEGDPHPVSDLAFIDGMHWFEFVLRDFRNIERHSLPGCVVVIDDILPNHPAQAERERRTRVWSGDVWRFVEVVRRYRPDLFCLCLDVTPTGLLLIAGLDPTNRILWDSYDEIVRKGMAMPGPPQHVLQRSEAVAFTHGFSSKIIETLKQCRAAGMSRSETVARLRMTIMPKISVVVVGYNMPRELPRTILSLSPRMQRGIAPYDYEVILIDNGSTRPADQAELRGIMPSLVFHRMPEATVSPVPAVNYGLSIARGDLVGVFIDGARMASPGLLAMVLAASQLHERPMIGSIAFHLGPKPQVESIEEGYDQKVEDTLLEKSNWLEDGYRLFGVSALALSSSGGWWETPAESNAFFLRAEHWRALGGYESRFVTPGGGLANLDMWSRVCADHTGELIMLLGEATFHQIHGGIATNNPNAPFRLFEEEYAAIRGFPYQRPSRRPLFFGRKPPEPVPGRILAPQPTPRSWRRILSILKGI